MPTLLDAGHPQCMSRRFYRIRLNGTLGSRFATTFHPMQLEAEPGSTVLSGVCVDTSALYGVLDQARNLGLDLLDVESFPVAPDGSRA
jgi:hypothetical protein